MTICCGCRCRTRTSRAIWTTAFADAVESLSHLTIHAQPSENVPRKQLFDPTIMLKIQRDDYSTGVFSLRKQAMAFRVLVAGNFPAHRTRSDVCALHLRELSALFVQLLLLARVFAGEAAHDCAGPQQG